MKEWIPNQKTLLSNIKAILIFSCHFFFFTPRTRYDARRVHYIHFSPSPQLAFPLHLSCKVLIKPNSVIEVRSIFSSKNAKFRIAVRYVHSSLVN